MPYNSLTANTFYFSTVEDELITWNFKDINNASTRTMVVNVVSNFGLVCTVLPEELVGEDDAQ